MNNIHKTKIQFIAIAAILLSLIIPQKASAIPSFARQTNLSCSSCHTIFPELTAFGRLFKLNGYTMTGIRTIKGKTAKGNVDLNLISISPLSAMIQTSYTNVSKPIPGTQNNTVDFPQQLSLFLGGQITPHIGTFVQITYDNQGASFGIDNAEIRYANHTKLGQKDLLYGVTLNNNPTEQDVWNSTPAWGFPYAGSAVAPGPDAATLIEDPLAQNVLGIGAYGLWNNLIYGEFSLYRSAQQGAADPPDATSNSTIKSLAPYWRFAIQHQFGNQYIQVGTFGISANLYPSGITGLTDDYTDVGFDFNYENNFDDNSFTAHSSYIHETQNLNATFAGGGVSNPSIALNKFQINGNYYLHHQIGFTIGYFNITGDNDAIFYGGNISQTPNSNGFTFQFNVVPWLNTKFAVQYVAYNKFNGSTDNYDGTGRNASDNNTIYLLSWIAL